MILTMSPKGHERRLQYVRDESGLPPNFGRMQRSEPTLKA
jgi:hypothetical protein